MTSNDLLDSIAEWIQTRRQLTDKEDRMRMLNQIAFCCAFMLRVYCRQQGNSCEYCVFALNDPERKSCECKINIGKNECGTAPRFWELVEKREADEKTQEPMQSGVPGQEAGVSQ